MLGFFNKLFKSKTPAPETQTQPENEQNNTPTAAENVPADRTAAPATAAEPNTSDTQPENTAAETAEQTAEPVAAQATEHSAQPEASANESANESTSASVETAEPEPAAQAQPENAEP
ncbi:MAG: signal recognition particle-docking protein FtsY, partial [Kingella oralis]